MLSSKRLKATGKGVLRSGLVLRRNETRHNESELKLEGFGMGVRAEQKRPMKKVMPLEEPTECERIPLLVTGMSSSDWKARLDSIDGLMEVAEKTSEWLKKSPKFVIVMETLVKGLTDSNAKVSLKAVNVLERFIPMFKTGIEQNVQTLLNGLSPNLGSMNAALKNKTDILIDLLVDTVESVCLVQPFIHVALYGSLRSRSGIIQHLCGN